MDLEFMQGLHAKEFATKESLASRASTIIAGITTLAGVLAFVAINFKSAGQPLLDLVFWILTAVSAIALVLAACYLIWSYRVPPLTDIASPKEWMTYWKDLQSQVSAGTLTSAEAKFKEYLLDQYAEIGDANIDANFNRGARLVKSNNALLTSFVLIMVTALAFYFNRYVLPQPATRLSEEISKMLAAENALVCIPATPALDAEDRNGPKPKPRPVPNPSPR